MTKRQVALAERNRHIAQMYVAGMSMPQLAREFMVTIPSVWVVLRDAGVPRRGLGSQVRWDGAQ